MLTREAILHKILQSRSAKEATATDKLSSLILFILSNELIFSGYIDTRDNNPESQRTALYQAVIKSYEKPEKFTEFMACVELLLSKQASLDIIDASNKTPDFTIRQIGSDPVFQAAH